MDNNVWIINMSIEFLSNFDYKFQKFYTKLKFRDAFLNFKFCNFNKIYSNLKSSPFFGEYFF